MPQGSTQRGGQWCHRLRDVTAVDLAEAGAKAATLGWLAAAGLPVPPGFVVGVRAFDAATAGRPLTEAAVRGLELPEGLRAEIAGHLAELGTPEVAVRSSAIAEDGRHASFAGQFASILEVEGLEAVLDAVRHCWASAFRPHVGAYARARRQESAQRMAVLVQAQLRPRCAGVAFSADPVTGDPDTVVINAVTGLGERLASGRASPDCWVVRRGEIVCTHAPERCLRAADARAIAALTARVVALAGNPQDIEWAFTGETLHLLQARSITALKGPPPRSVAVDPPPGYWERNDTYYPYPLSPMFRSFFLDRLNAAYRRFFEDCGALALGGVSREIGGWVYMRLTPLGGRDLPVPPPWLMKLAFRLVPAFRRRIRTSVEAIRTDRFGRYLDQWSGTWRPGLTERARAALALDMTALSDREVAAHVESMEAFVGEALEIHFLVLGAHFFPMAELAFTCRELFGWDERRCLPLVAGLSEKSTEPAAALESLAALASRRALLRQRILDREPLPAVLAADSEFAAVFQQYREEHGHRVLRYEVSEPTVAEQAELILSWVRAQIVGAYDGRRTRAELRERRRAAAEEARALLASHPSDARQRFERALERAARAYAIREDNEISTLSAPLAVMRYATLELGRRLAQRGCIDRPEHVFWLALPEALASLSERLSRQTLVRHRQAEHAWVKAHPGPRSYGRPPSIPRSAPGLPPEADFVFRAGLWMRDHGFAPAESSREQPDASRLDGIAASGGTHTGPVRVVRSEAEFAKIRSGDVLVCPITAPVWSVLFTSIGALVTDTGGLLSHSAIIAREYGIPAVVATGNATRLLQDGQLATVDGDAGEVRLIELAGGRASRGRQEIEVSAV